MNKYQILFDSLKKKKEKCFVPFVIIGDPSYESSLKIVNTLIKNGADALELGFPFSDPMSDGITIQNANLRAFHSKININKCFNFILEIRNRYPDIPIGILTYANIVFSQKINVFFSKCALNQIDSVLIADVPIEESYLFHDCASNNKISMIYVCPPNANNSTIKKICKYSSSFIYLLSRPGVTGTENKALIPQKHIILECKINNSVPLLQGFGISTSQQIKKCLKNGVSGVICGSVIVEIIEKNYQNHHTMLYEIEKTVIELKQATL
ncbi:Tryptophan synthase alpha chain [Buchnera aphidicola (Thelaxes suberi)]|uniref:tryptophan synthase subunit alpha n=1 Tax=Buchnera aphidicola TaxID=9 RepID=UPI003463A77B